MRSALFSFLILLVSTQSLSAGPPPQAPGSPAQLSPEQVQALLDRIAKLETRVAELEAKTASGSSLKTEPPASTVSPAGQEPQPVTPSEHTMSAGPGQRLEQELAEAQT